MFSLASYCSSLELSFLLCKMGSPAHHLHPSSAVARLSTRAPSYLHGTVIPEVKAHGFNSADVWEVAVDAGAIQTDEDAQLVGGPVGICGAKRGAGELGGELGGLGWAGGAGRGRAWRLEFMRPCPGEPFSPGSATSLTKTPACNPLVSAPARARRRPE